MLGSKETEHFGCVMSFTFSSFMLGFRVLYRARPIKLIQLFQQSLLLWHGFSVHRIQLLTMLHQEYQPLLLVFAALLLLIFRQQHCQTRYQDMVLFQCREIIRGIWLFLCWSILSCFTAFTYRLVNVKIPVVFINILI